MITGLQLAITFTDAIAALGGVVAIGTALYYFHGVEKRAQTLAARCDELEKKSQKDREDFKDGLGRVTEYYDQRIERQDQEIKQLHDGIDRVAKALGSPASSPMHDKVAAWLKTKAK